MLREKNPQSREELLNFMKNYYFICLITHKEDDKLREVKLTKSMPKNWTSWKERYDKAGIKITINPGQSQRAMYATIGI